MAIELSGASVYLTFGDKSFPVTADDLSSPGKIKFSFQQDFEDATASMTIDEASQKIGEQLGEPNFNLTDSLDSLRVGPLTAVIDAVKVAQFLLTDLLIDMENNLYRIGVGVRWDTNKPKIGPISLDGFAVIVEKKDS